MKLRYLIRFTDPGIPLAVLAETPPTAPNETRWVDETWWAVVEERTLTPGWIRLDAVAAIWQEDA